MRSSPATPITTELTPQVNGYYAQICRTLVLGEPSKGQLESFAVFSEAQQAAQDLIKPGINASDAARAQNDVFASTAMAITPAPNTHAYAATAWVCFPTKRRTFSKTSIT